MKKKRNYVLRPRRRSLGIESLESRRVLAAPTVASVAVNTMTDPADLPAGPQPTSWMLQHSDIRNIVVTFSEDMLLSVSEVRLTNLGLNPAVDADEVFDLTGHFSLAGDQVTLSFTPQQLDDGVYQLDILPAATNLGGDPLDGDANGTGGDAYSLVGDSVNRFYKIKGDWSNDGVVSLLDHVTYQYWFGLAAEPPAPNYADLNNDGGISVFDISHLAGNFSVTAEGMQTDPGLADDGVIIDFAPSVGTVTIEDGTKVVSVDPNTLITFTSTVTTNSVSPIGVQLDFGNSDTLVNELVIGNWMTDGSLGSYDQVLNSPTDHLVGLSSFSPITSPATIGTFQVQTPAVDGNYLLTVNGASGSLGSLAVGQLGGYEISDFGDVIIRVGNPPTNSPPVISVDLVSGQIDHIGNFFATGSFVDPDNDNWTATVDFGDGVVEPLTLNPDKTFELAHQYTFAAAQTYQISITVADDAGGSTTHVPDQAIITGTDGNDTIEIIFGSVIVKVGGVQIAVFETLDHMILLGGPGDDNIAVEDAQLVSAEVYGGAGNDIIVGGGGENILSGGDGNDLITGGSATNVLIGGDGDDTLTDGGGENTIIGGTGSNSIVVTSGTNTVEPDPAAVAPEVYQDFFVIPEDNQLTVNTATGVLTNDISAAGGILSANLVATTSNGQLTLDPAGSFTYLPGTNFFGTDFFEYTVSEVNGGVSNVVRATISVTAVNDPPLAPNESFSVDQSSKDHPLDVLRNVTTPEAGEVMSVTTTTVPDQGGAVRVENGTDVFYTPDPDFIGTERFQYTVSDGNGGTAVAMATVTVVDVAPYVVGFGMNQNQIDPADLAKGPQPTSWQLQRSDIRQLSIQFNETIQVSLQDISLVNLGVNAAVDADQVIGLDVTHFDHVGSQVTLTFEHQELPDGVYEVHVLDNVVDTTGNALDGDGDGDPTGHYALTGNPANLLYKLSADWSGDLGISVFDFTTFSYWFGVDVDPAPAYVDLNSDDGISVFDFSGFADHFGEEIIFSTALLDRVGSLLTLGSELDNDSDSDQTIDEAV
ncbi:MAG: hypothetical protein ACI9G1_000799, partial [Pirellulaceae bacterium]